MAHRRVGIHGLQQQARKQEGFQRVGEQLAAQQLEQMQSMLQVFKSNLEDFALKHKKDIKRDPTFRMHFQQMCHNVGVDPLASNKGFWAEMLGVGDFYYELGVQIAQVCIATREKNGGYIEMEKLKKELKVIRGSKAQAISEDDIIRSIKSLKTLGSGFEVITVGGRKIIQSVPRELNTDTSKSLSEIQEAGSISAESLATKLSWELDRSKQALEQLVLDGICWVDEQLHPKEYWIAGLYI